jgi:hypothetical protein
MTTDIISSTERAHFSKRYRLGGLGPEATINYAVATALAYADKHALGAPDVIRNGIARVFIHYTLQSDAGEKKLLMIAIDRLIDMGRVAHARNH